MMSCACGRRSIGNTRASRSASSSQPPAICGDSDDVAHVSMMSGSATKPPGLPRWDSSYPSGQSLDGSTGSYDSSGSIGLSYDGSPSSPTGYQSGIATPKN